MRLERHLSLELKKLVISSDLCNATRVFNKIEIQYDLKNYLLPFVLNARDFQEFVVGQEVVVSLISVRILEREALQCPLELAVQFPILKGIVAFYSKLHFEP